MQRLLNHLSYDTSLTVKRYWMKVEIVNLLGNMYTCRKICD